MIVIVSEKLIGRTDCSIGTHAVYVAPFAMTLLIGHGVDGPTQPERIAPQQVVLTPKSLQALPVRRPLPMAMAEPETAYAIVVTSISAPEGFPAIMKSQASIQAQRVSTVRSENPRFPCVTA
jgi:hypothetical protein